MPTDFDESDFPLVRVHAHGQSADSDVEERLAFAKRLLQRREKVALVFDTTGGRPLTARQRKMWADWLTEHDVLVRKYLVGCAIVVDSALTRGVFTGVFWLWSPPMPYTFAATPRQAEAWARERLAEQRSR